MEPFGALEKTKNGELGLGNNNNQNIPKQVMENVEQIAVGNHHTIVLTNEGEVYTWGQNTKGQLGTGNTVNSNIPQKIEIPIEVQELVPIVKEKVVKVIANKNVSYALTNKR